MCCARGRVGRGRGALREWRWCVCAYAMYAHVFCVCVCDVRCVRFMCGAVPKGGGEGGERGVWRGGRGAKRTGGAWGCCECW